MTKRAAVIQGELQTQVMRILWRLGQANVEQVRAQLPLAARSAYTTVQTVMNRLAERGFLARERTGNAFVYTPNLSESEYLSRSLEATLAGASKDARRTVLAQLVGNLDRKEIEELRGLAREVGRRRQGS